MTTELTIEDFRTQFPEFEAMPDNMVSQRLSWAHTQCDVSVWGDYRSIGVGFLTAHYCAMSPGGEDMRLERSKGMPLTFYELQYNDWVRRVAGGARVAALQSELTAIRNSLFR